MGRGRENGLADLVKAAARAVNRLYHPIKHRVGAAVRTKSGKVFTAVAINGSIGRCDVCAEVAAIAKAVSEGESEFDAIVAVKRFPRSGRTAIVSPCGVCRELISDFGDVTVVVQANGTVHAVPVSELLPNRYRKDGG